MFTEKKISLVQFYIIDTSICNISTDIERLIISKHKSRYFTLPHMFGFNGADIQELFFENLYVNIMPIL